MAATNVMKIVDDRELSDLLLVHGPEILTSFDTYASFFEEYNSGQPIPKIAEVNVLVGRLDNKDLYLRTKIQHLGDYGQIIGDNPLNKGYITKMPNIKEGNSPACDGCWVTVDLDYNRF